MKTSPIYSLAIVLSLLPSVTARRRKGEEDASKKLERQFTRVLGGPREQKKQPERHLSGKGGICEDCLEDFDTYYVYDDATSFHNALTSTPTNCVLAAINDEVSYYGAKFAIPDGKRALISAYLDTESYLYDCHIDDHEVTDCDEDYNDLGWVNLDETNVPTDDDIWADIDFPIPAGLLNLAMTSDGLLYPVASWNSSAFDGGIYQCCPELDDVCNEFEVEEAEADEAV